ncbi:EamA family transporter [Bradyrhizobium sp. CCBAU 051011]|uniref:DMT family transporter n=1 Tax=Bradyrhizobium sp. CCBAU 051011 TaxID=858422 RepID=UPI001373BC12|nr:DMT family transporter [Bradyrhizobium sp. CCBAU 051011]QHO73329.1 EamA family transporter [Bradyrhizobium sp. CCBAU 051011]
MIEPKESASKAREVLGLLGFLCVATAQVSNMILARGVAGSVPPFSIAFFRWSIVALGLLPAIVMALRERPGVLQGQTLGIAAAGFLGMFVCGGPVYLAGVTTSAINLALIMALAPLAVLLFSFMSGQEPIHRSQIIGMLLSLAGAALIITKGQAAVGAGVVTGDLLALMAMLGWAGYTLLQNRVGSGVSFLARIGLFAAAGALFSLPFAIHEMWTAPAAAFNGRAALVYLFAGLVPGLFAYSAYAYLGAKFGAVSTSLSLYLGPIVSAVLSILFLGEAPTMIHLIGGALSLGGMWLSLQAKQSGSPS